MPGTYRAIPTTGAVVSAAGTNEGQQTGLLLESLVVQLPGSPGGKFRARST